MRCTCDDEDHEWEVAKWRCGLGQRTRRPVFRCTQCGCMRPASDFERDWMTRDVEVTLHASWNLTPGPGARLRGWLGR